MADSNTTPAPEGMLSHSAWVQRLARALVGPREAEDLVQQTWLAALQKPPRTQVLNLRSWLGGVVRRVARDRARTDRRRERRERRAPLEEMLPSTGELVEKAELHRRVVEAVLEMREPFRSALLLYYFEGRSSDEIARHLNVPASTVRNRVHRGIDMLRRRFLVDAEDSKKNLAGLMALAFPGSAATAGLATTGVIGGLGMGAKLVAALMIVGVVGVGGWMVLDASSGGDEGGGTAMAAHSSVEANGATQDEPVSATRTPDSRSGIHGVVQDPEGRPLANVPVFFGGQPSPLSQPSTRIVRVTSFGQAWREEDHVDPETATGDQLRERGLAAGITVNTDEEGRFELPLSASTRVFVAVAESFGVRPVEAGKWHDSPGESLTLVARPLPFARVQVSVLDETRGEVLPSQGSIYRHDADGRSRRVHRWHTDDPDTMEPVLELPSGGATAFRFQLREPFFARHEFQQSLKPGEDRDVVIPVQTGEGTRGRVVGPADQPLAGAVVFWGTQRRIRGEWDWSPYRPEWLSDAVHTDEQGGFHLPGHGDVLSVWHAEFSPATAVVSEAELIRLEPRGHIHGRLVNARGEPMADEVILLNDRDKVTTDAEGRFRFESVEAGIHGLMPEGESYQHHTGVVVAPDEVHELDMVHSTESLEIAVRSGGRPLTTPLDGLLVGLDDVFTLQRYRAFDGTGSVTGTRPGRYVLLSSQGTSRTLDLREPDALVDMGVCSLTVYAEPGAVLCLVPTWIDDVHKFARDQAYYRRIRVDDSGRHVYAPIPAGDYRIHDMTVDFHAPKPVLAEFSVSEPGTEVRLNQ